MACSPHITAAYAFSDRPEVHAVSKVSVSKAAWAAPSTAIGYAHGLGQGRGWWRRGVKIAGFDFAQGNLGAARPAGELLLCQPKRHASLLKPLSEGAWITHCAVDPAISSTSVLRRRRNLVLQG